jgi:drug/metabolite transporter (DMT)-like permease
MACRRDKAIKWRSHYGQARGSYPERSQKFNLNWIFMTPIILVLIVFTILFNTAAQLALKVGIVQIGAFVFHWSNLVPITWKVITSPWIITGLAIYLVSVGTWLMVLSRTPVSIAYPMSSLGYVTSAIAAYYLLGEDLTPIRVAGTFVILIGVYMVAKS